MKQIKLPHRISWFGTIFTAIQFAAILAQSSALAGSATWNLNPATDNWFGVSNWTPATVPNDTHDTATFDVSNVTSIETHRYTNVAEMIFSSGASSFTIASSQNAHMGFRGAGIVNNSGVIQHFDATDDGADVSDAMTFYGAASAGTNTLFTTHGSDTGHSAGLSFWQNSTAGTATVNVDGAKGGPNGYGAEIYFFHSTNASHANFFVNGGTASGARGGDVNFVDNSSAASAVLTANGSEVSGGLGGSIIFNNTSTAANATLIANGGIDGGLGGNILFVYRSQGGNSRLELFDNGRLEIGIHLAGSVTVGSVEGNGLVALGSNTLAVGSNNRDTIFSGTIQDGDYGRNGSLMKVGTGRLVLNHPNYYKGSTIIADGQLLVNNRRDSGTGPGPVMIDGGALGGSGSITGSVTVGSGTGTGAFLSPGQSEIAAVGTLSIRESLSWQADSIYQSDIDSDMATADEVIAGGVTIDAAAQFTASDTGGASLAVGTIFTAISNTSSTAISGTFSNLPDGAIVNVNGNNLQASYTGDGNDLTLTVVP